MARDGKHSHPAGSRSRLVRWVSGYQIARRKIGRPRTPPPAAKAQPAANSISQDWCARRVLDLSLRPEKFCVTPLKWVIVPGPIEPQPIVLQVTPRAVLRFAFNIEKQVPQPRAVKTPCSVHRSWILRRSPCPTLKGRFPCAWTNPTLIRSAPFFGHKLELSGLGVQFGRRRLLCAEIIKAQSASITIDHHFVAQRKLPEIIQTNDVVCLGFGMRECREQKAGEDCNDCDDDEQFDQGEGAPGKWRAPTGGRRLRAATLTAAKRDESQHPFHVLCVCSLKVQCVRCTEPRILSHAGPSTQAYPRLRGKPLGLPGVGSTLLILPSKPWLVFANIWATGGECRHSTPRSTTPITRCLKHQVTNSV